MVSSWQGGKVQHRAVNACLCPMYAVEGCHVVTVEGELATLVSGPMGRSVSHGGGGGVGLWRGRAGCRQKYMGVVPC
jgi:hypothetical protein